MPPLAEADKRGLARPRLLLVEWDEFDRQCAEQLFEFIGTLGSAAADDYHRRFEITDRREKATFSCNYPGKCISFPLGFKYRDNSGGVDHDHAGRPFSS